MSFGGKVACSARLVHMPISMCKAAVQSLTCGLSLGWSWGGVWPFPGSQLEGRLQQHDPLGWACPLGCTHMLLCNMINRHADNTCMVIAALTNSGKSVWLDQTLKTPWLDQTLCTHMLLCNAMCGHDNDTCMC